MRRHAIISAAAATFVSGILLQASHKDRDQTVPLDLTCTYISDAISSASDVYWPSSLQYSEDVEHWSSSSSDIAACSVEPGTTEDLSKVLQIIGSTRTPFAVKGGGHATNPGFSSTTGVHIAMSRFSEVKYNSTSQTAEIGSGLIWDDVYAALEPFGVNVLGGRASGIGVDGFTLGGGYSWLTNQHGLTIDTVEAFELILPNGNVTTVTSSSSPDLFFGLKGGSNDFGIVTKFTLKTFPQDRVWGGPIIISGDHLDKVNSAATKFSAEVTDSKAAIIVSYVYIGSGALAISLLMFCDGPLPPDSIFSDFLAIPSISKNISTQSFLGLIKSTDPPGGSRVFSHTFGTLEYSRNIIDAVVNETTFWGQKLSLTESGFTNSYSIEPFLPTILSHAAERTSAYPPTRARRFLPTFINFDWELSSSDNLISEALTQSVRHLNQVALAEGQDIANAPLYGNYALFDTPLERIFGDNIPRLKSIKAKYDPHDVMGLAGGWKL